MRYVDGKPILLWQSWIGHEFINQTNAGARYHEVLGWILAPNANSEIQNSLDFGIRANSPGDTLRRGGILAVGDSFTAGSEVSDKESWPAYIEQTTGINTNNAGVGGYGVDQAVLRGELLFPDLKPDLMILGILDQDILRVGFSMYGRSKPYFTMDNSQLVLNNVPVPPPGDDNAFRSPMITALGYSYVFDRMLTIVAPELRFPVAYERVDNDEVEVTCALIKRFRDFLWANHVPLLVVMQYGSPPFLQRLDRPGFASMVIDCINDLNVPLVDEFDTIRKIAEQDEARFRGLYVLQTDGETLGHMSPSGNRLIADLIIDKLSPWPTVPKISADLDGIASPYQQRLVSTPTLVWSKSFHEKDASLGPQHSAFVRMDSKTSFFGGDYWQELVAIDGAMEHYLNLGPIPAPPGLAELRVVASAAETCIVRLQLLTDSTNGVLTDFNLCKMSGQSARLGKSSGLSSSLKQLDNGWVELISRVRTDKPNVIARIQLGDDEHGYHFTAAGQSVYLREIGVRVTEYSPEGSLQ